MDYGKLFRRGWEIVWQNKYLFILGFLAALGGGGGGNSGSNFNYNVPGGNDFPADAVEEMTQFWGQYGGLIIGLLCFFFILGIVFWLIRLAAVGGLIESVDRIEAGEKMSFGKAFSAGVARIWSLVGVSLLLNLPFLLIGLLFAGAGASFFATAMDGGSFAGAERTFGIFFACLGLLVCLLIPLGIVIAIVQPFALRGLMLKQLGVVDSIRHGWQVVRNNIGDILLLGIAFMVIGFLFGLVTLVFTIPFAFLAAGPFIMDAFRGNAINFGVTEVLSLAFGGICLGLVGAAVNSVLTAYRSATVTLAYHQFVQKDGLEKSCLADVARFALALLDAAAAAPFLLWLGLGMSLSSLFGTGWRLWGAQFFTLDFAQLTNIQTIESLLFSSEIVKMQQLLLRGLLLAFGQFVLVWLLALLAEAGIIGAVTAVSHNQPTSLRRAIQQGRHWLGRFLAIDLLVFFPWFLIALLMLLVVLVLALVLASFATSEPSAGAILGTTGLGMTCLIGLAGLLLPVGLVSLWYRLLAFREAMVHEVAGKTAVRQTWQRIRRNFGDVFVLVIMLWGGQTLVLGAFNLLTSPLLTWLTPLTNSGTMALQATSWLALLLVTLLVWVVRSGVTVFVAIAWTLAYLNLSQEEN